MKKVMILGAAYTQVPLYEAAKRLGIRTVAASIPGDYPGFALADECAFVDILDPAAVIREGKERGIDGVATMGFDLAMPAYGAVCEELGLPGPSKAAAERASDKLKMKEALTAAGVRTAAFRKVGSEEELNEALSLMAFPLMVKAVDQNGSRGITRCDSEEEARAAFALAMDVSKKPYCLLEEFIDGTLLGVEGMVQNGRTVFLLPNETEVFYGATGIPVGHLVPFRKTEAVDDILTMAKRSVFALGLDNCAINCDLILTDRGAYVVELTGRAGANGLPELTGIHYNLSYHEMILRLALGEDVRPFFSALRRPAALSHILKAGHSGILCGIEAPKEAEGLVELSFNVKEGDRIRAYTNCADRIGQILITAETPKDCLAKLDQILTGIHYEIKEDEDARIHRYPVL